MSAHITEENCTGCLACQNVCPVSAIKHDTGSGFILPDVDKSVCIGCGKCLKVCPKEVYLEKSSFLQKAYAVKRNDIEVLKNSTSGGAFSSVADYMISLNGVVYGCALENGNVRHIRVEHDYSGMRGSKYVQSDLNRIHSGIFDDLKNGRNVLFTGTPCQCASVRNFLLAKGVDMEKLVLVDFVCHGVTSPILFGDYISYCEKKYAKNIENHVFRTKVNGWTKHTEMNIMSDGTSDCQSYESQLYKSIFYSHLGMNESCFHCRFASTDRVSDITLADFWGIKRSHPELFDENGVSFVLINTEKGERAFECCKDIDKLPVSISDTDQPSLQHPAAIPPKYDAFWNDYRKNGFNYVVKKYYHGGKLRRALSGMYHKMLKE